MTNDNTNTINLIDQAIGRCVRSLRLERQLSVCNCAAQLSMQPADFEAAEAGMVRFFAWQMFVLADLMDCEISDFFAGLRAL